MLTAGLRRRAASGRLADGGGGRGDGSNGATGPGSGEGRLGQVGTGATLRHAMARSSGGEAAGGAGAATDVGELGPRRRGGGGARRWRRYEGGVGWKLWEKGRKKEDDEVGSVGFNLTVRDSD